MRPDHSFRQFVFPKELGRLPKSVKWMSLMMFVYFIGWGIVNPFLPLYFKEVLGSYAAVGLITGLLSLFSLLWVFPMGEVIDRVMKRNLIFVSLLMYLPLSVLLLSLKTLGHFVYFRLYHSFIATSYWLTTEAYVREHSTRKNAAEAIGLYDFGYALSTVIGALLGAFLIVKFKFSIIHTISLFAFFALLMSFRLPDHGRESLFRGVCNSMNFNCVKTEWKDFFRNKPFRRVTIYSFFFYFVASFFVMILPLFLDTVGANFFLIGIIVALANAPMLLEPYFSTHKDKKRLLFLALFFAAALFVALFVTTELQTIFIISLLIGMAFSAIIPVLGGQTTVYMVKGEVGKMSAVSYAVRSLAGGLGPLAAGALSDAFGLRYVFLLGAVIFASLLLFVGKVFEE